MARRFRKARRYVSTARKTYRRARTFGKAGKASMNNVFGNALDGVITGAVQSFVPDDLAWGLADPMVPIAVGWFRNNPTLMTLGGYQLGAKLISKMGAVSPLTGGAGGGTY